MAGSRGKDLVVMGGVIRSPPMSDDARRETGFLLRLLQEGESVGMPKSRPMPSIGPACHELRVQDENTTWRCLYFLDQDAVVVLEVFAKKTNQTPKSVIDTCKLRIRSYRDARAED